MSAEIIKSIDADVLRRLTAVENVLNTIGGDTVYVKTRGDTQVIDAPVRFNGQVQVNNSVQFSKGSSVSESGYSVKLPKNTFRHDANDGASTLDDKHRVATGQDIDDAVSRLQTQMNLSEQILDMDYSSYSSSIKIAPNFKNSKYHYDSSSGTPNVFYRYAGIREAPPATPNQAQAASQGAIYKQGSGFNGIPLTKSYKDYKALTVVCLHDAYTVTNIGSAKRIHSVTIPVFDIDLARQYI